MATRELPRQDWEVYFNFLSRASAAKTVQVEITGEDIGDQRDDSLLLLRGVSYDPKDDMFYVFTDPLKRLIPHPQKIYVDEAGATLAALQVIDRDGNASILILKDPLMLPPT